MSDNVEKILPIGNYKLTIIDEPKYGESKSKKKMLTIPCELSNNDIVETEQGEFDPNGIKLTLWALLEQNTRSIEALKKQFDIGEINVGENDQLLDEEGTPLVFKGQEFWALCRTDKEERKDGDGNTLINPVTDEPYTTMNHRIVQVS